MIGEGEQMQSKRKNVDKRKISFGVRRQALSCAPFCFAFGTTAQRWQNSVWKGRCPSRCPSRSRVWRRRTTRKPARGSPCPAQHRCPGAAGVRQRLLPAPRHRGQCRCPTGCVFADYACDLNSTSLSRNLVLYGHTFEDGYEGGSRRCTITSRTALPKNILTFISRCPTLP